MQQYAWEATGHTSMVLPCLMRHTSTHNAYTLCTSATASGAGFGEGTRKSKQTAGGTVFKVVAEEARNDVE